MKLKKTIKIIAGVIVFLTLPTLLLLGYIYFKYNEDVPVGIEGEAADALADNMLDALDYEAYKKTDYIEWTYQNKRRYEWDKVNNLCTVRWKEYKVDLHLNFPERSKAYVHSFNIIGEQRDQLVTTALNYFNNDSFWLVAPYKVYDDGVKRSVVKRDGKDALLVTYTQGGTTPGDSYLWSFDTSGKPVKFKMWTDLLPMDGLEASWTDWTTTSTGAQLPTFHKILFFGFEINHIKTTR
jgi:hypothetical protein